MGLDGIGKELNGIGGNWKGMNGIGWNSKGTEWDWIELEGN